MAGVAVPAPAPAATTVQTAPYETEYSEVIKKPDITMQGAVTGSGAASRADGTVSLGMRVQQSGSPVGFFDFMLTGEGVFASRADGVSQVAHRFSVGPGTHTVRVKWDSLTSAAPDRGASGPFIAFANGAIADVSTGFFAALFPCASDTACPVRERIDRVRSHVQYPSWAGQQGTMFPTDELVGTFSSTNGGTILVQAGMSVRATAQGMSWVDVTASGRVVSIEVTTV